MSPASDRPSPPLSAADEAAIAARDLLSRWKDDFVDFVSSLAAIESPTDHPETQAPVQALLGEALEDLGFRYRIAPGTATGGHLFATPARRRRGVPAQLLIGHTDTVWPLGTLDRMPITRADGKLSGPGVLDMKGGLTQMVFALRALRELGLTPRVEPVLFVNSDEETGSPESKRYVEMISRRVCRTFVLEPGLTEAGLIKTARKGVGNFEIAVQGRASHAGLDPEAGRSAIVELAHLIQTLHALNAPEAGSTVNVGVVRGGTRPNVVAAQASAEVDLRVVTSEEGDRLTRAIHSLGPVTPDVSVAVTGGVRVPPLERTPRNMRLWDLAQSIGSAMGLRLDHGLAGGGSDGNTTSLYTATLDGLGCVGDGAHALHEHIIVEPTLDRCALLAGLLMTEADEDAPQSRQTPETPST